MAPHVAATVIDPLTVSNARDIPRALFDELICRYRRKGGSAEPVLIGFYRRDEYFCEHIFELGDYEGSFSPRPTLVWVDSANFQSLEIYPDPTKVRREFLPNSEIVSAKTFVAAFLFVRNDSGYYNQLPTGTILKVVCWGDAQDSLMSGMVQVSDCIVHATLAELMKKQS